MTDDLISRQAVIGIIQGLYPGMPRVPWLRKDWQERYEPYINAEKAIRTLPSAQPEIIHCRDCKWFGNKGCAILIVDDTDKPSADDYCSFAERRNDEQD